MNYAEDFSIVKHKHILASLLGALVLITSSCGTSDKATSVTISSSKASSGGFFNLVGADGTLQLIVTANYTSGKTVVVNDVKTDPRYIGGEMVKSTIVVPILIKNQVVAELDIESYFVDTFTRTDQDFIESCAALVGRFMEQHSAVSTQQSAKPLKQGGKE